MDAGIRLISHHRGWTLFNIQKFIERNQKKILSPSELGEIFGMYKSLRSTFQNPAGNRYCLNSVLGYIIEQTFRSKVDDSGFVLKVVNCLIENDGHIGLLINLSEELTTHRWAQTVLEFFLKHVNRRTALFGGLRLVNVKVYDGLSWVFPLELAIKIRSPFLMYQLLRYGAVWSYQGYSSHLRHKNTFDVQSASSICSRILGLFIHAFLEFNPAMENICNLESRQRDACGKLISCTYLILRDSPQFSTKILLKKKIGTKYMPEYHTVFSIVNLIDTIAVPGLLRNFMCPLRLKHLCKLEVRKNLNYNWQLPAGIYQLNLPKCLENYLDLECD